MVFNQWNKPKIGTLPEHHYVDDARWINEKLGYLNEDEREKICRAYSKVFKEEFDKETVSYKKINSARYAANTRLREFINKRLAVFNR